MLALEPARQIPGSVRCLAPGVQGIRLRAHRNVRVTIEEEGRPTHFQYTMSSKSLSRIGSGIGSGLSGMSSGMRKMGSGIGSSLSGIGSGLSNIGSNIGSGLTGIVAGAGIVAPATHEKETEEMNAALAEEDMDAVMMIARKVRVESGAGAVRGDESAGALRGPAGHPVPVLLRPHHGPACRRRGTMIDPLTFPARRLPKCASPAASPLCGLRRALGGLRTSWPSSNCRK